MEGDNTKLVFSASSDESTSPVSVTQSGWRSIFKWYWPTSLDQGAVSERVLLQEYGNIPVDDPLHVQLQRIPLGNDKQRFINTLILDQNTVHGSASERTNIILCHGFGAGLGFLYKNVWPLSRLVPNCRVYAIDLLGMGRSGRPEFPKFQINNTQGDATLAVDFFLDSFEEWRVKQDGLEKFVLVGHSMGGYLSALYALRHPQKVRKLILASPVGLPEQVGDGVAVTGHKIPSWISHLWNANYTPQGMLRGMGPLGPRFAHGYINNRFPYLPEPERISLATYFYHISADSGSGEYALAALLAPGAWAREPLHSRLPKLAMPTTFMYGENDWMDKRHAAAAAEKMTVEVDIISVSQAGHHLNLDNPQEFNRIVADQVINI